MVKRPKDVPHVKFVVSKGKFYAYFNTGKKNAKSKTIYAPLPDLADPSFWPTYAGHMKGRSAGNGNAYTVRKLVTEYEDSADFARKAMTTQRTYAKYLRRVVKELGDFPVNDVHRADVRTALKPAIETPGAFNLTLSVIGTIFKWAREHDKTEADPTKDIKKMDMGTREPWPDYVLEAALTSDDNRIRLAVHILYFTGLRINDALKLRWTNIQNGFVNVIPTKTVRFHKALKIKIAQELADELAQTPRRGMTILSQANGKPIGYAIMLRDLKEFVADFSIDVVPHGLRKNAVNSLLEAGCTVPEVSAITGQSFNVVEQYAKRMNRGVMSESAVVKLEARRAKNA